MGKRRATVVFADGSKQMSNNNHDLSDRQEIASYEKLLELLESRNQLIETQKVLIDRQKTLLRKRQRELDKCKFVVTEVIQSIAKQYEGLASVAIWYYNEFLSDDSLQKAWEDAETLGYKNVGTVMDYILSNREITESDWYTNLPKGKRTILAVIPSIGKFLFEKAE
jgi:hypothetical protein